VSGAVHQSNFDRLSGQGYRIISLSVYGEPTSPLYAAVWAQRPGAAWVEVHGVNAVDYQSFFNTWTAKGYAPTIISATGLVANAVFAAVFEQGISGQWLALHDMTSGQTTNSSTFQYQNTLASTQNMMLQSFAIYGTLNDRRYAAIWKANPGFVKWHVHPADTATNYQTSINAETQMPGYTLTGGYRPAYVALSEDKFYCSVFRDDVVGPWVERHGMTAADYQTEFSKQNANGFYLICVQGGGSGDQTRYAAIFAQQDIPSVREWTVTGTSVPALAGLDNLMQTFMQVNAVRTAQLTVSKNGDVKFARAYTWAEPGYKVTQPSDVFLLASCSKIFTTAAIQSLINAGKLSLTDKAYPKLGFSNPADQRSDTITIDQLLNHTGGYDDSSTGSKFDPTYSMRQIGLTLSPPRSPNKLDICRYMYARKLDFAPGTENHYSNYGYLLLSALVENLTGQDFFTYVNTALLQPAGITEVLLSSTLASERAPNEAICEDAGLGLSPIDLNSQLLTPSVYGGDGQIKEVAAGCAGIAASATALARFISNNTVWWDDRFKGERNPGVARSGSTPGTSTWAESRAGGIDLAFCINTRNWPPQSPSPTLNDLTKSIDALLAKASL